MPTAAMPSNTNIPLWCKFRAQMSFIWLSDINKLGYNKGQFKQPCYRVVLGGDIVKKELHSSVAVTWNTPALAYLICRHVWYILYYKSPYPNEATWYIQEIVERSDGMDPHVFTWIIDCDSILIKRPWNYAFSSPITLTSHDPNWTYATSY